MSATIENKNWIIENDILKSYLVKYTISFISPVIIGNGEDENTDIDICKLPNGQAYIPFTSWIGVLKHHFFDSVDLSSLKEEEWLAILYFWGDCKEYTKSNFLINNIENKLGYLPQSHFYPQADFSTYLTEASTHFRDGVRLNEQTKLVEAGAKYDFEILNQNAKMEFNCIIDVKKGICEKTIQKCIQFIFDTIDKCAIGAKTNSGYGKQKLVTDNSTIVEYDFSKEADQLAWFLNRNKKEIIEFEEKFDYNITNTITISANAEIVNTLLIGGGADLSRAEDKFPIATNGKYVFRGDTLKGVIISQMKRIANTLLADGLADEKSDNLFGYVNNDDQNVTKNNNAKKGRLIANESNIEHAQDMVHHRIKIDHFTGGTFGGAKFDAKVLNHNVEEIPLSITINKFLPFEPIWLLHAFKDLLTQSVAIGAEKSIGRGRLHGKKLNINITQNDKESINIECTIEFDKLNDTYNIKFVKDDAAQLKDLETAFKKEFNL